MFADILSLSYLTFYYLQLICPCHTWADITHKLSGHTLAFDHGNYVQIGPIFRLCLPDLVWSFGLIHLPDFCTTAFVRDTPPLCLVLSVFATHLEGLPGFWIPFLLKYTPVRSLPDCKDQGVLIYDSDTNYNVCFVLFFTLH